MSRIGKQPIAIPAGVTVAVNADNEVTVKGPKGELKQAIDKEISIKQEEGNLTVERTSDQIQQRAMHGLYRSIISNMVKGVTGTESVNISFVNSSIYPKNIKKDLASLIIYTGGTISSIKNTPIMGQLPEYADNTAALVDLIPGALYKNNVTKEVTQVV